VKAAEDIEAEYRPIVKRIANKLSRRVPEHMLAREELEAIGMLGLLGAMKTYDNSLGVPFRPYAIRRIYGQMVDAVRKLDPVPHPTRAQLRRIERASERVSQRNGRSATEAEIAAEVGMEPGKLAGLRHRVAAMTTPRHVDERVAGDDHDSLTLGDTISGGVEPHDEVFANDEDALRAQLRRQLDPIEVEVIWLTRMDGLDVKEVSETLNLGGMQSLSILLAAERKLGARDEAGRLVPLTPKRKGVA
jgi:RNA polymerase sigma factor FliA